MANALAVAALAVLAGQIGDPTAQASVALRAVLIGYLAVHGVIAALIAAGGWRAGWRLWQDYSALAALIAAALAVAQGAS